MNVFDGGPDDKRRLAEENGALGDEQPLLTTPPALRQVASATWRELIKRIWEVDPLICPQCSAEAAKLAVILIGCMCVVRLSGAATKLH